MKFTKNIVFKNFKKKLFSISVQNKLNLIINKKSEVIDSLKPNYNYSYSAKRLKDLKKKNFKSIKLIGMGGSILGTKAIYEFLGSRVKKKILFFDNLKPLTKDSKNLKKNLNIVISKSGNTLETISNVNLLIKENQNNIFITDKNQNYLRRLANKMKAEIIDHNNFIGGRYSVLSEVGMLPLSLAGLSEKKFKQFNNLIKNKNFINSLISNVSNIVLFTKKKKFNSVIVNYDESSNDLFKWYQQLVAESLGKKQKGIYPLISTMPKDNHSLLQLYLDGPKKSFFTFFNVRSKSVDRIKNSSILKSYDFLKNKKFDQILYAQQKATEAVFDKNKIPYRSFEILDRNEETLGELFSFFILETILLGKILDINPFDQPAVELIKVNTKKILKKN